VNVVWSTVPACAVVSIHIHDPAGIVASSNKVTILPDVVEVVVDPPVTTSIPVVLRLDANLIVYVKEGVVPIDTA
jgi:hypothetical protein